MSNSGLKVIEAIYALTSIGRYSPSRKMSDRDQGESDKSHDAKHWKERCHVNDDGFVIIPPMCFTLAVKNAIKLLGIKIPGKRNQTYSKLFDTSVLVFDPLVTDTHIDNVKGEVVFVPSDGVPGGGKRVDKTFPYLDNWKGNVTYTITTVDSHIPESVFTLSVITSGRQIGVGRFRPANRGYYGRFTADLVSWEEVD